MKTPFDDHPRVAGLFGPARVVFERLFSLHQMREQMKTDSIYHGPYETQAIDLNTRLVELTGFDYVELISEAPVDPTLTRLRSASGVEHIKLSQLPEVLCDALMRFEPSNPPPWRWQPSLRMQLEDLERRYPTLSLRIRGLRHIID